MVANWVVQKYREGDEKLILQLRTVIRGWTHSDRYWRWRYVDNPAGPAIIWLAVTEGIAVGHSAMIPTTLKVGGTVIRAGLSVDAWTHPDFRHQGIFTTLHRKVLEDAGNQGVKFAYTFPNNMSYPGFMKLGYSYLFPVPAVRKVINWSPVLKAKIGIPSIGGLGGIFSRIGGLEGRPRSVPGIDLKEILAFDDRLDQFWMKVSQHYDATVVRDSKYLNWRYVDNPRYEYTIYVAERRSEVLGYVILNCVKEDLVRGYIVDLLMLPEEPHVLHVLIGKSIEHFRGQKADTIHAWMFEHTPYYKALRKKGFHQRPLHSVRFCGSGVVETMPELVRYSKNWWMSPGDYDL